MDVGDDCRACWICYDPANADDPPSSTWVSPCACKGPFKWVHQACPQRFYLTATSHQLADGETPSFVCNLCTQEYRRSTTSAPAIDRYRFPLAVVYLLLCAPFFIEAFEYKMFRKVFPVYMIGQGVLHRLRTNRLHGSAMQTAIELIIYVSTVLDDLLVLLALERASAVCFQNVVLWLLVITMPSLYSINVSPYGRPYLRLFDVHVVWLLHLAFPALAPRLPLIDSASAQAQEGEEIFQPVQTTLCEKAKFVARSVYSVLTYATAAVGFCAMFGVWCGLSLCALSVGDGVFREHARLSDGFGAETTVFENFDKDT